MGYLPKSATLDDIHSAVKTVADGGAVFDPVQAVQACKLLDQFVRWDQRTRFGAPVYDPLTVRELTIFGHVGRHVRAPDRRRAPDLPAYGQRPHEQHLPQAPRRQPGRRGGLCAAGIPRQAATRSVTARVLLARRQRGWQGGRAPAALARASTVGSTGGGLVPRAGWSSRVSRLALPPHQDGPQAPAEPRTGRGSFSLPSSRAPAPKPAVRAGFPRRSAVWRAGPLPQGSAIRGPAAARTGPGHSQPYGSPAAYAAPRSLVASLRCECGAPSRTRHARGWGRPADPWRPSGAACRLRSRAAPARVVPVAFGDWPSRGRCSSGCRRRSMRADRCGWRRSVCLDRGSSTPSDRGLALCLPCLYRTGWKAEPTQRYGDGSW
jgi:hypothetical protein